MGMKISPTRVIAAQRCKMAGHLYGIAQKNKKDSKDQHLGTFFESVLFSLDLPADVGFLRWMESKADGNTKDRDQAQMIANMCVSAFPDADVREATQIEVNAPIGNDNFLHGKIDYRGRFVFHNERGHLEDIDVAIADTKFTHDITQEWSDLTMSDNAKMFQVPHYVIADAILRMSPKQQEDLHRAISLGITSSSDALWLGDDGKPLFRRGFYYVVENTDPSILRTPVVKVIEVEVNPRSAMQYLVKIANDMIPSLDECDNTYFSMIESQSIPSGSGALVAPNWDKCVGGKMSNYRTRCDYFNYCPWGQSIVGNYSLLHFQAIVEQ